MILFGTLVVWEFDVYLAVNLLFGHDEPSAVKLWSCEAVKLWSCEAVKLWSCEAVKLWILPDTLFYVKSFFKTFYIFFVRMIVTAVGAFVFHYGTV